MEKLPFLCLIPYDLTDNFAEKRHKNKLFELKTGYFRFSLPLFSVKLFRSTFHLLVIKDQGVSH